MLACDSCQNIIADALYDQLDGRQSQQLEQHLNQCPSCQTLMNEMQQAKQTLEINGVSSGSFDDIPERAALEDIWQKLEPSLDREDAQRFRQLPKRRSRLFTYGPALALAASIVFFFSLLTVSYNDEQPSNPIAANQVISPDLMNYLTRAEVMLLLVANAQSENDSQIPLRQGFARNMASEASFLSTNLEDDFNSGQSKLLKDIEFLLLQVANLDESNMEQGIDLLQRYIETNSVLFKIRLLEMRDQEMVI